MRMSYSPIRRQTHDLRAFLARPHCAVGDIDRPHCAVGGMNRPYCAVVQQQQPLWGCHSVLVWFPRRDRCAGAGPGAGPGGTRQSLGPRGSTQDRYTALRWDKRKLLLRGNPATAASRQSRSAAWDAAVIKQQAVTANAHSFHGCVLFLRVFGLSSHAFVALGRRT